MVKVDDTVKLVERYRGWCDARNLGRNGIVISVSNNYARVSFEGDDLPFKTDSGSIEALQVISNDPPSKITQNGYEYSLVGPVKPEWLVDGVWVVGKIYGTLFQVIEGEKNNFSFRDNHGRLEAKEVSTIVEYYRPHEPKDWEWGDWAMYDGKRVFVMSSLTHDGLVGFSFPNIDGTDLTDPSEQWDFAEESELIPTF